MSNIVISPLDRKLVDEMFCAFDALRRNGWQEPQYAPYDTPLEFIVCGSTGVFRGERGSEGKALSGFWLEDSGDIEFCSPILWRRLPS